VKGYGFLSLGRRVMWFFHPSPRRLWNFSSTHMRVFGVTFKPPDRRLCLVTSILWLGYPVHTSLVLALGYFQNFHRSPNSLFENYFQLFSIYFCWI
jgi:hypothetical protein